MTGEAVSAEVALGRYLRQQREARQLSLGEMSRATKIKEANLVALEEGRFTDLPPQVFLVGFVEAYARAVGADVTEALGRLGAAVGELRTSPALGESLAKVVSRLPTEVAEAARAHRRRWLGGVLLACAIVALISYAVVRLVR